MDAPEGYAFKDLYDAESMQPKPFYQRLYDEVKEEFISLGFKFKNWTRHESTKNSGRDTQGAHRSLMRLRVSPKC